MSRFFNKKGKNHLVMNIVSGGKGELALYPNFFCLWDLPIFRFINHKLQKFRNLAKCCGNVLGKFRDNPSCTKLKLNLRKYELNSGSRIEWNVDILENIEYI